VPIYRLYNLSPAGLIAGPPEDFEAADDVVAIKRMNDAAKAGPDGHGYELWERARRVAVLAPDRKRAP
jgi:hypothetical protein